jgi:hypothetical protein
MAHSRHHRMGLFLARQSAPQRFRLPLIVL